MAITNAEQAEEQEQEAVGQNKAAAMYYYHDSKQLLGDFSGYIFVKALEDASVGDDATGLLNWLDGKYSSQYGGHRHFFRLSDSAVLLPVKSHEDLCSQLHLEKPFPPPSWTDEEKTKKAYRALQKVLQDKRFHGYRWKDQELYIHCEQLELKFVVINQERVCKDQVEAATQQEIDARARQAGNPSPNWTPNCSCADAEICNLHADTLDM